MARSVDGKGKRTEKINYPSETSLVLVVVCGVTLFVVVHCNENGFRGGRGKERERWKMKVGKANKGKEKKSREERAIAYFYTVWQGGPRRTC